MNHKKEKLRVFDYFQDVISIENDIDNSIRNAFKVNVNNNNIQSYFSGEYFVIESCEEIKKEDFIDLCRCILISLSFITGYAPGDYAFIFRYGNDKFIDFLNYEYNSSFTKSIDKSIYSVIDSNVYNYCQDYTPDERTKFVENNRNDFKGVSESELSKLCCRLLENDKFSDGVYSIIEARQSSLIAMG
ncbi:hypothetical protein BHECKSOX_2107 [Bathymodiolus heckerae thiotrophic gill symbiont]|uniref:hypothetical protein n=1 Tax=Bathymodiolus heckerae thiotrophic gill symbiont TaxID=1052212 RepID=UPI0010B51412|nr:hypothetical protein [Bathymodiolus heckerae thiotrophic gill symbiont]SHN93082.1 hypothetical protein BHECKSOX_2107 [Bathymodiolus heckerae thiotrophic gill symbiont]